MKPDTRNWPGVRRDPSLCVLTDRDLLAALVHGYTTSRDDGPFLALKDEADRRRAPHLVAQAYEIAHGHAPREPGLPEDEALPREAIGAGALLLLGGQGRAAGEVVRTATALAWTVGVLAVLAGMAAVFALAVQAVSR